MMHHTSDEELNTCERRISIMKESIIKATEQFSGSASWAALSVQLGQLNVFGPIRKTVQIVQKAVKHTSIDKLYDAFISILAGIHGMVEINTHLLNEPILQSTCGRTQCV
jgi:hypothetical protein